MTPFRFAIPPAEPAGRGGVRGGRIAARNGPARCVVAGAVATTPGGSGMDDSTRESLASAIEHPCAPCVYGQHDGCLAPIGDKGNCCCDELDGWAERE